MGLGEWFGVKQCRVDAESCRTIEELFARIRDGSFAAGTPELYRKINVIAFPAIDRDNQVQIFGENGQFTVMRSTMPVGSRGFGPSDDKSGADPGRRRKRCMELCQITADEINAMHL